MMEFTPPAFRVERPHARSLTVRLFPTGPSWEQWLLCRSDAHHDNTHCHQELEKKHLEEAKARNALLFDFGDACCAMQGKWDKRADPNQFRPELQTARYLDDLVAYNAEFYRPYAPRWVLMARGNHEAAILQRHHTDLTERIVERLRAAGASHLHTGDHHGWVRFLFNYQTTKRQSLNAWYTHGYGGGGPVTRDVIQSSRQLVYLDDVDLIFSGHTHDAWEMTVSREYLTPEGVPKLKEIRVVKCGGYKDEYSDGQGWANLKGFPPKPLGAYWVRFYLDCSVVRFQTIRAD